MVQLFEEIPYLEDDAIVLKRIEDADADALHELAVDEQVYRYLPTYLVERLYSDPHEALRQIYGPVFEQRESLFLGIYLKEDGSFCGIVELYDYREHLNKVSLGYRLLSRYWGRGIASRAVALVIDYLSTQTNVETLTADTMVENAASARVLEKNGFIGTARGVGEDWGYELPTAADKWFY